MKTSSSYLKSDEPKRNKNETIGIIQITNRIWYKHSVTPGLDKQRDGIYLDISYQGVLSIFLFVNVKKSSDPDDIPTRF